MLFAPLVLNQLDPEVNSQSVASKWTIGTITANTTPAIHSPLFVQLYRQNEWLPGMLCFLAFTLVMAFAKKEEPKKEMSPGQEQAKANATEDEIAQRIAYYDHEIAQSEKREAKILYEQKQAQNPSTQTMTEMLATLKEKEKQEDACKQERDNLTGTRQILLNDVKGELAKYKRDYKEALANDPTKNTFIHPVWETEADILHYYKIKAQ
ncbi:MAG: hypothetical protein IT249_19160, partial [Chitinophagaceae bacterium]|nr:hypothetical protein [Chitinophagaceae bacterium]